MFNSVSVIGGADGPTSIFLAGETGSSWLNIFGLIIVVLILIPNIVYALKVKDTQNRCRNRWMNILEQIGRYGCMIFMVFNIPAAGPGFRTAGMLFACLSGNLILIISYWILWLLYFIKPVYWKQMALAVIPVVIFLWNGITRMNWPLVVFSMIFGAGHIYVTYKNRV